MHQFRIMPPMVYFLGLVAFLLVGVGVVSMIAKREARSLQARKPDFDPRIDDPGSRSAPRK
jgi:hypothetical protein